MCLLCQYSNSQSYLVYSLSYADVSDANTIDKFTWGRSSEAAGRAETRRSVKAGEVEARARAFCQCIFNNKK